MNELDDLIAGYVRRQKRRSRLILVIGIVWVTAMLVIAFA